MDALGIWALIYENNGFYVRSLYISIQRWKKWKIFKAHQNYNLSLQQKEKSNPFGSKEYVGFDCWREKKWKRFWYYYQASWWSLPIKRILLRKPINTKRMDQILRLIQGRQYLQSVSNYGKNWCWKFFISLSWNRKENKQIGCYQGHLKIQALSKRKISHKVLKRYSWALSSSKYCSTIYRFQHENKNLYCYWATFRRWLVRIYEEIYFPWVVWSSLNF